MENIKEKLAATKWRSVDEELPGSGVYVFIDNRYATGCEVLGYNADGGANCFYSEEAYDLYRTREDIKTDFTHWMKLPDRPESKKQIFERLNNEIGETLQRYYNKGELTAPEIAKYMRQKSEIATFVARNGFGNPNYRAGVTLYSIEQGGQNDRVD